MNLNKYENVYRTQFSSTFIRKSKMIGRALANS
jgi:hypothetical protein